MELVLIRLVDMSLNAMFSNTHCRSTGGVGFNQTGGHNVLKYSL